MSSDMTSGPRFDSEGKYAALDERVQNQGVRLGQIESAMNRGFSAVENSITSLSAEFRTGSKPQWQAFSLLAFCIVTVLGGIGTMVWLPIKADISEIKGDARTDRKDALSVEAFQNFRLQYDGNRNAYRIDTDNQFKRIDEILKTQVPRGEHEREWRNTDLRFQDQQRQIDDMKRFQSGLISAPDFLKGLDERLRLIEMQRLKQAP